MKNTINYYYNIVPTNIHQTKTLYRFDYKFKKYILYCVDDVENIDYYYELSLILNNYNIYTHRIILNNQNEVLTIINNKKYVLFQINVDITRKVTLNEIIDFSNKTLGIDYKSLDNINWKELWLKKQDYFEYQLNSTKNRYPLLKESSPYFFGLTYLAIALLNEFTTSPLMSVTHKRITPNTTLFDFYNPFNFVIDTRVRDTAEYFKNSEDINMIYSYIQNNNLSNEEMQFFLIRLIYPSYYYDLYEDIITNKQDEHEVHKIIQNIENRELVIKKTYMFLLNICSIPLIDWLIIK